MSGEVPGRDPQHPEKMEEAIAAINKACDGTGARLKALKVKYKNNPSVMKKLNAYDEIE